MIYKADKAYKSLKVPGETITACFDRLHKNGYALYQNGRKLSSLEIPLIASISNLLVISPEGEDNSPNNIKAFTSQNPSAKLTNYQRLPFTTKLVGECPVCKGTNCLVATTVNSVPATNCERCWSTDFTDSVKQSLSSINLLKNFDAGYQKILLAD